MKKLIQSKTFIGALTAVSLSLIEVFGVATAHDSHSSFTSDHDGYTITVTNNSDANKKHYQVNGVNFYWNDLTKAQQQQLAVYEKQISQIEEYFEDKDGEFTKLMQNIDKKTAAIEAQMQHLNDITFALDSKKITLRDFEKIGDQIDAKMEKFELALEKEEFDLSSLEHALDKMEFEKLDGLDEIADQYEQLLLKIAEQRKTL